MDTQLQQLRDAVKAVAKARAEGRPIDLSALPPEIRQKIQAQLDKLPPDARAQLQGGMAKVEGAAQRAAGRVNTPMHSPVIPKYEGHYNGTVRPGDATRFPVSWIAAVLLGAWLIWKYTA
ncbi:MAG: hypothetical protein ACREO3_01805 [Arenimonas sp.]